MSSFPEGKQWEDVSLQLGQVFVRNREYTTAIDYYNEILKAKPEHAYKIRFSTCWDSHEFQDARFEEARQTFQTLSRDFPTSDKASPGLYWVGMTYLFEDNYKDALDAFNRFTEKAPTGNSIRMPVFARLCASMDWKTIPRRRRILKDF